MKLALANEQKIYSDQGSCIESLYIDAVDLYNLENRPVYIKIKWFVMTLTNTPPMEINDIIRFIVAY